jgi:hypothetical protein
MYKFVYFNSNPIEVQIDEKGLSKLYYEFDLNTYLYKEYELKIVESFESDKYYLCMMRDNVFGFKKPDGIFIYLGTDYSMYNYTVDQQLRINIYYKLGKLFMSQNTT